MEIIIHNEQENDLKGLDIVLEKLFSRISDNKNMHIIICDNKKIKELNKTYRNINKETDVLSFPDNLDIETNGDIFISYEKIFSQAKQYNHTPEREIAFLAVHGYLHLKGYNHLTKEEENIMNKKTYEILNRANIRR